MNDEQQIPIPITMERLIARGYEHSSSWGMSSSFAHRDNPGWKFCNDFLLVEGCYPIIWTGNGRGRNNGKPIRYINELQRMEETTPKQ